MAALLLPLERNGYPTQRRVAARSKGKPNENKQQTVNHQPKGKHRRITTNCNATTIELYHYSSGADRITTNCLLLLAIIPYDIIQSQRTANNIIAFSKHLQRENTFSFSLSKTGHRKRTIRGEQSVYPQLYRVFLISKIGKLFGKLSVFGFCTPEKPLCTNAFINQGVSSWGTE